MIARTKKFLGEVRTELGKATWPWDPKEKGFKRYKELYDSTVVVIIGMIFLGAFVSFTDLVLASVTGAVTRTGYESRKEAAASLGEVDPSKNALEEPTTKAGATEKADSEMPGTSAGETKGQPAPAAQSSTPDESPASTVGAESSEQNPK